MGETSGAETALRATQDRRQPAVALVTGMAGQGRGALPAAGGVSPSSAAYVPLTRFHRKGHQGAWVITVKPLGTWGRTRTPAPTDGPVDPTLPPLSSATPQPGGNREQEVALTLGCRRPEEQNLPLLEACPGPGASDGVQLRCPEFWAEQRLNWRLPWEGR